MASAAHLAKLYESAQKRISNMREKGEEVLGETVAIGETVGGAFIASYARARMGDDNGRILVGGLDADLLAGLAMHAVGFMGGFGKYDEHAHNLGSGFLACWATHKAYELGLEAKNEASQAAGVLNPRSPRVSESAFDQNWAQAAA